MSRGLLIALVAGLGAWWVPAAPAAEVAQAQRYIALVAERLSKSGPTVGAASAGEPGTTWQRVRRATVISGPTLTRSTVARVLSDRALRGRRVVLHWRGHTTAGASGPPAWLVHSSLSGADALLDPARLITAADMRRWLARSGAASAVLFVEGGEGVETWCASLDSPTPAQRPITAWCQRSGSEPAQAVAAALATLPGDAAREAQVFSPAFRGRFEPQPGLAGKGLKGIELAAQPGASVSYYLLRRGATCRPPMPGAAELASWADRIEWSASGAAMRWGSRCNDTGTPIERSDPELRMSSDGALLLYRGERYVRLAQAPRGDGFDDDDNNSRKEPRP